MTAPLDGLRVLDLSRILAGPFCTMMLGDMGAEVIKVEHPKGGDDTRSWPPFYDGGESTYFQSVNRNKKSLTLDLKAEEGKRILRKLVEKSDIFLQNFRPGAIERLGLGYEEMSALNPRLIYASVSGYGQTGPNRERPAYDILLQAEGGLMSITGEADGISCKTGIALADLTTALFAIQGILLAVIAREKTGRGQFIDMAIQDGQAALMSHAAGNFFGTGVPPGRMGNRHPSICPYRDFTCSDGALIVAAANDSLWDRFARAIGRADLADDPRWKTNDDRVKGREELEAEIDKILAEKTRAEWGEIVSGAGVPCGPVKNIGEVASDPQVLHREMVIEMEHAKTGTLRMMGIPVKLSDTPGEVKLPPPILGEHTGEILGDLLGEPGERIAALRESGVI
ncbi:MAG: CoA transferase [Nitrospinota bacterium]|nr:CoA transferase [Nitrospinota bacterium]MDP7663663.1 CoA transferase [Nitrospinota bacterium]